MICGENKRQNINFYKDMNASKWSEKMLMKKWDKNSLLSNSIKLKKREQLGA